MIKFESYKRATINSTLLNIAAKGLVFLNTIVISFYFGGSINSDFYFYVISVSALICSAINGIDYLLLIPESINIRENESQKKSEAFLNFFLSLYGIIGAVLLLISILIPIYFFNAFSKFDINVLQVNKAALIMGSFIIFFQIVNNLMIAILTSYKYFTSAIFSSFINSLLSIILTIVLNKHFGILGSVLGVFIGYITNFIILLYLLKNRLNWSFRNVILVRGKRIWTNILFMEINIVPVWIKNYIILLLISGMVEGSLSAYNLGNNIAIIPEVFILSQVMNVAGIKFSELFSLQKMKEIKELFYKILDTLLLIIIPMSIVICICSSDIVEIVFMRGKFSANNVVITAKCLMFLSFLLPIKIFDAICTRLFTSNQLYKFTVIVATFIHLSFTILTYFLCRNYKLEGLLYSLIIGNYIFLLIGFCYIIKIKCAYIIDKKKIQQIIKLLLYSTVIFIITMYFHSKFQNLNNFIKIILTVLMVIFPFFFFFLKERSNYSIFNTLLIKK